MVCISTHKDKGGKRARTHRERSRTLAPNARLSPSHCPSLWWNRGCHAVTVRGRRTNKCFPPRRWDLNGKATWQLCSERPHNQTPHPERHTSTSVQEAFPTRRFTHVKCTVQSPGDVVSVGECLFVLGKIVVVGIFRSSVCVLIFSLDPCTCWPTLMIIFICRLSSRLINSSLVWKNTSKWWNCPSQLLKFQGEIFN